MAQDTTGASAEKPVSAGGEPPSAFAPARYCWLLPIFGMGMSVAINFVDKSLGIAGFFIFVLSIVAGLVLSIIYLVKGRGHMRTLIHSIAGLAVNFAFIGLLVLMFLAVTRVRANARAARERQQRMESPPSQPAPGGNTQPEP